MSGVGAGGHFTPQQRTTGSVIGMHVCYPATVRPNKQPTLAYCSTFCCKVCVCLIWIGVSGNPWNPPTYRCLWLQTIPFAKH